MRVLGTETTVEITFDGDQTKHVFDTKKLNAGLLAIEEYFLTFKNLNPDLVIEDINGVKSANKAPPTVTSKFVDLYNSAIKRVEGYGFPDDKPDFELMPNDDKRAVISAIMDRNRSKNPQKASGE